MRNQFCARWVGRHSVDRGFSLAETRLIRLLCIVGVFAAPKVSVFPSRNRCARHNSRQSRTRKRRACAKPLRPASHPRGAQPRSTTGRHTVTVFGRGAAGDAEDAAFGILNQVEGAAAESQRGKYPCCPMCGWMDVRRSTRHGFLDRVVRIVGLVPYRCRSCGQRFYRPQQDAPEAAR
jgi:hypothetical protein